MNLKMGITNKIFRLLLLLSAVLVNNNLVLGQDFINSDGKEELIVGANAHYGWVIVHHASFRNLITGHTRAFEVNIGKQTIHKNSWNEYYRYPTVGISYYFADIGNPAQLGYVDALYSWINFPLVRSKAQTFSFRLGTGLGYITKKFDRVENYKNEVIGSHINGVMHFNFMNAFNLTRQLAFYTNIGITHLSNGAYKTPNLGINICTGSAGFSYRFGKDTLHFPKHRERLPFINKKWHYNLLIAGGAKEVVPPDGQKFFVYTVSALALRKMGYKSSLGLGLDYFHDASLQALHLGDSNNIGKPFTTGRVGIYAAHELQINKVNIVMNIGYYLLDDYKANGAIYNRLGFKYYFLQNLCANVTLKTHWAKADFLELGIGYKIK